MELPTAFPCLGALEAIIVVCMAPRDAPALPVLGGVALIAYGILR